MPTTRKSTAAARGRPAPVKGQSTISFSGKVTKSVPKDIKDLVTAPAIAKVETPEVVAPAEEEVADVVADEEEPVVDDTQELAVRAKVPEKEKSEAELKAEAITDAHINKYWKAIEKERAAPRVHQEGLPLSEKVLRYFDVSSQYGPCIGTPRLKRWERAERLGLSPPIEVLAVLLKEEKKGNSDIETAEMDKILNSTTTEL